MSPAALAASRAAAARPPLRRARRGHACQGIAPAPTHLHAHTRPFARPRFYDPEMGNRAARRLARRPRTFSFVEEGRFQKQAEMARLRVREQASPPCPAGSRAATAAAATAARAPADPPARPPLAASPAVPQARFGDTAAREMEERRRREAEALTVDAGDVNLVPIGKRVRVRAERRGGCGCKAGREDMQEGRAGTRSGGGLGGGGCGCAGTRAAAAPEASGGLLGAPRAAPALPPALPATQPCRTAPSARPSHPPTRTQAEPAPVEEPAPAERVPNVEWWDARILADRTSYGDAIGQPARRG